MKNMNDITLNSNLILLIRYSEAEQMAAVINFKFQSDSINTLGYSQREAISVNFKFQSDSINTYCTGYTNNHNHIL